MAPWLRALNLYESGVIDILKTYIQWYMDVCDLIHELGNPK